MTKVQKKRFKNGEYIKYDLKEHFIRDYDKGLKGIKNLRQYPKKVNTIKKLLKINEFSIKRDILETYKKPKLIRGRSANYILLS